MSAAQLLGSLTEVAQRSQPQLGPWHVAAMMNCSRNWEQSGAAEMTYRMSPGHPLLSRLSDVTSDATYEPSEVAAFLEELRGAQQIAKEPARFAAWTTSFA
jgi:hypothetical protein